jgi:nucleoid-associated protein YgaU
VDVTLEELSQALIRGEPVKLRSFGEFAPRAKRERIGRNPKTGVEAPIRARRFISFHASPVLGAGVNCEAYMFLGMQLMMSTPRAVPQSEAFVVSRPVEPSEESPAQRPASREVQGAAAQGQPSPLAPAGGGSVRRYVIRSGDTFTGIATRLYGDPRLWRRIAEANNGLDPRRLPVGHSINLPEPVPPQ